MKKIDQDDSANLLRERAIQVFTYLRELARLHTKVTRDVADYEKVVWFHDVPERKGCFTILADSDPNTSQDGIWLEIQRTTAPARPPVPSSCREWLEQTGSSEPTERPQLVEELHTSLEGENGARSSVGHTERLADHPEVTVEWQRYMQDIWSRWETNFKQWQIGTRKYDDLFTVHQRQKTLGEQYELILGLGLLTWETPNKQAVRRHVLVGDALLSFDANRAKFTLQAPPEGIKLRFETEMIDPSALPPASRQKQLEGDLEAASESPWDTAEMDKILRSWVNAVSPRGAYTDLLVPPDKAATDPVVAFAPALILRQRTQRSQIQCFTQIIERLKSGENPPAGIRKVCETPSDEPADGAELTPTITSTDPAAYLPLAANEEQLQILDRVRVSQGILVQGPPGTGKSHTIANLICHLLAQGKRVLVTSQTPRALRVLKDKIPKNVSALCVVLLGNDQTARQELEESVQGINQAYSSWNLAASSERIKYLESQLYETRKLIAGKKRISAEMREMETRHYEELPQPYRGTVQHIVSAVRDEEAECCWIIDPLNPVLPCPITNAEFRELLRLSRELSADYCTELRKQTVSSDLLPALDDFVRMVDAERTAKATWDRLSTRAGSSRFLYLADASKNDRRALGKTITDLLTAIDSIKNHFPWTETVVTETLAGKDLAWQQLHDFMREHLEGLQEKATLVQPLQVRFSEVDRDVLEQDAMRRLQHLESGGWVGWWVLAPKIIRQTRYICKRVWINGKACEHPADLRQLVNYLEIHRETDLLWSAWADQYLREEGPILLQVARLHERFASLGDALALREYIAAARRSIKYIRGLPEPLWDDRQELDALLQDINAAEALDGLRSASAQFEDCIRETRVVMTHPGAHALNHEMLAALETRDASSLAHHLDHLCEMEKARGLLLQREELERRLASLAPTTAAALRQAEGDSVWDQRADCFERAWAWRRADSWVAKFMKEHEDEDLQWRFERLVDSEKKFITELAASKAWDNCLRRLSESQRGHLMAWAATVKKIPKTLGAKTRPKRLREAQEHMDKCKGAIPAWIMPLHRVFETVTPEPDTFDVAIIDEASQTGPEGLILQYLAKQCIIVGDSEQISPAAVGVPEDDIDALIRMHLDGVPFRDQFGPATSLFTHADIRFGGRIVLREHFRCMPEIIQFSNELCYSGTPLKAMRQYPPDRLEPIVVKHVNDGFREGGSSNALNRPEAEALVETIARMCSMPQYMGKTMGVISLQGEAQARHIERLLLARLGPSDLEERRIVCGDAYAFQGDERDVIFLSMVAAPNQSIHALTTEADKRRFNVAASRAKDQLVLFHTATLSDLHPDCMRHKLLEYCLNPLKSALDIDLSRCESEFEKAVCRDIAAKGYRVIPQYSVAEYRIDLVIEGAKSQFAVECDGDEWHGVEQFDRDMARQRILERAGWKFCRIRGYEYYRNPITALEPLWKMLHEMGIDPNTAVNAQVTQSASGARESIVAGETVAIDAQAVACDLPPVYAPQVVAMGENSSKVDPPAESASPLLDFSTQVVDMSENSRTVEPSAESDFSLLGFLTRRKIEFIDMRAKGGALWMIGDNRLSFVVLELKTKGIIFSYVPRGGRTTGFRPSWFTNSKAQ